MTALPICKFSKSLRLAADTEEHLFVAYDGGLPDAEGDPVLGATERKGSAGEYVGVLVLGQGVATSAGAIAVGDEIIADAAGKGKKKANNAHRTCGRAVTAAAAANEKFAYIAIAN